ncbi:MAG: hypothetical protein LBB17_00925 [Puniceicoccales bacterium]|jgi:hypothetical protein|nr:hypothetical protein [Puniceicoccales bacterium]
MRAIELVEEAQPPQAPAPQARIVPQGAGMRLNIPVSQVPAIPVDPWGPDPWESPRGIYDESDPEVPVDLRGPAPQVLAQISVPQVPGVREDEHSSDDGEAAPRVSWRLAAPQNKSMIELTRNALIRVLDFVGNHKLVFIAATVVVRVLFPLVGGLFPLAGIIGTIYKTLMAMDVVWLLRALYLSYLSVKRFYTFALAEYYRQQAIINAWDNGVLNMQGQRYIY